jgi:beta-mannanase
MATSVPTDILFDLCRSITKNVFYIWSPVGNQELKDYWPGAAYADYVVWSVYAFP